jgi:GAF domain-containing protein
MAPRTTKFGVHCDQQAADSLAIRAQSAIRASEELVRLSYGLRAQTELLNESVEGSRSTRYGIVQAHHSLLVDRDSVLGWTVSTALRITKANMANLQLFDPGRGALHIAAQYGFGRQFLDYFDSVHEGEAACGEAFKARGRVVVEDVTESPIFRGTTALEVLLDTGVRAVQSTPLIDGSGTILGILSTHWSSPRPMNSQDLLQVDLLARTVANWLRHKHS